MEIFGGFMGKQKPTIQDVADMADVSIATVSRIINNKGNIKPSTLEKVELAMKELNFIPKTLSMLSEAQSKIIMVCVPNLDNPFNSPVLEGIHRCAHANGYHVLILETRDRYSRSEDFEELIRNNSIAGMVIMSNMPQQKILEDLSFRCPTVMCSEYAENYDRVSYVSIDDSAASKKAVDYLISTGREKISLINTNLSFKYARHREKGYRQALEQAGLPVRPEWIIHLSTTDYKLAFSNIYHMLSQADRPDAIFATSDVYGVAAINAAHELGLLVPEDRSVVGFDNIDLSVMCIPPLTTIEQPCFQIGYQSCELLIDKIINPASSSKQILLNTELIVRGSTLLPKAAES